jgi:hypothetical protein
MSCREFISNKWLCCTIQMKNILICHSIEIGNNGPTREWWYAMVRRNQRREMAVRRCGLIELSSALSLLFSYCLKLAR